MFFELTKWSQIVQSITINVNVNMLKILNAWYFQELYSRSYQNVGVIFALIPNFASFYREDQINNGGIECMRVLNEIIQDFDDVSTTDIILNEPWSEWQRKIAMVILICRNLQEVFPFLTLILYESSLVLIKNLQLFYSIHSSL